MKRFAVNICALAVIFLYSLALAAPDTQTFPVTVSNAVSGKLETVPVTFRIGATNGVVERFDGQRFVPVPMKPYDYSCRDEFFRARVDIPAERILHVRLNELVLPEQQFEAMSLSNAIGRLTQTIRHAETMTSMPVVIKCMLRRTVLDLSLFTMPRTNAWGSIMALAKVIEKAEEQADQKSGKAGAGLPITAALRGANTVILLYEDDGSVTRSYPVPDSFYNKYTRETHFAAFVRQRLKDDEWGEISFMRGLGRIRVTCYSRRLMARFETDVYEPMLELLLKPARWTPVSCDMGPHSQLYFRGANNDDFGGLRRYRACLREGALQDDVLETCPVYSGMADAKVVGPSRFSFVHEDKANSERSNRTADDGWFLLFSHDGSVMRLEGDQVFPIKMDEVSDPLFLRDAPAPREKLKEQLSDVIVSDITMRGDHITNGLAQIQVAIQAAQAPTNRIRIAIDLQGMYKQAKAEPEEIVGGALFAMGGGRALSIAAITNVPAFCARQINAYDALVLLADVTGLEVMFDGAATVELVAYSTYTQRLTRVRSYPLPERLCVNIPTGRMWSDLLRESWLFSHHVEAYSVASRELKIRSDHGDFDKVSDFLEDVHHLFPARYMLENKNERDRPELILTDTYRGIERRYRSGIGKDGKRRERFERVK